YVKAIELNPDLAEAYGNRANVLRESNRLKEAMADYDKAIQLRPDLPDFYYNRADLFLGLGRYQEALADYEKAHALNPDLPFLCGERLDLKFFVCNWQDWEKEAVRLREMLENSKKASSPFSALSLPVTRGHLLSAASTWTSDRFPPNDALPLLR